MKCKSSWIRKTVLIVRLSTSCRNVWRTKCTSTSRCSSRCRTHGIDQLFPVLPLEGLDQVPERRSVLLDITCDSDGAIDHYIDGDGIATTMPMPEYDPENPPMLGFFMVGAYQEILGNMHNLFGDTEAVDVFVFLTVA